MFASCNSAVVCVRTAFRGLTALPLLGCSNKDIRERFKKLALKWHPDKNILNPDEAQKVSVLGKSVD